MAAAKKAGKSALRVTAPLVQAQVGKVVTQFSCGDILPDGVSEESAKWLTELGYVEETEVAEAESAPGEK